MGRLLAILGSAVFLIIGPGMIVGYVPWRICRWHFGPPLLGMPFLRFSGIALLVVGLPFLVDTFAQFAFQGRGTPAPIFPTSRLVVNRLYRYVRNPMYMAIVLLILGQGLLFGSARILGYGALVWIAFSVFVLLYEEPTLRAKFGREYEEYRANVRRWIPRLRPWR